MRHELLHGAAFLLGLSLFCAICGSCADDILDIQAGPRPGFSIVGTPVQVRLGIAVDELSVDGETRAEEPVLGYDGTDSEEERHIDDLWLFEYDGETGALVYHPQHVVISDQSELEDITVTLSDNNGRKASIYVVANAGSGVPNNSKNWVASDVAGETYDGFMTIGDLEANVLPTPHPQRMTWDATSGKYVINAQDAESLRIPMSGCLVDVRVTGNAEILVPVERMFAKVMVRVDLSNFDMNAWESAALGTVTIGNIPEYCTVGTLWDGVTGDGAQKADYSGCPRWIQRRFASLGESKDEFGSTGVEGSIYPYVIYVPENIQGEHRVGGSTGKPDDVPNALSVMAGINVVTKDGSTLGEYQFAAYPGGNSTTNFNVRRNCLYRVTMKINDIVDEILPSANCIFCPSGETTAFWPYCRTEIGGGYDFSDYLGAYDGDNGKRIASVGIIWQSLSEFAYRGFIGDNTDGSLVWIDDAPDEGDPERGYKEYHRKIHVKVPDGELGNALVGAYDSEGQVIWSWHIWTRPKENDPRTFNTKLYYTYDWDANGIYGKDSGKPRVAGYTLMNCNLGAMVDKITGSVTTYAAYRTYGTLYQWGRKDPFPPFEHTGNSIAEYNARIVGNYFDNGSSEVGIVGTGRTEANELFYSEPGTKRMKFDEMLDLTIKNPCVFYCGTKDVNVQDMEYIGGNSGRDATYYTNILESNYPYPHDGNWLLGSDGDHCNRLWGGLDPENDNISKSYDTGLVDLIGNEVHMYDDYGEKSIFDPCPYGWRVSPPDLWLGFTDTGLNPVIGYDEVNYDNYNTNAYGMAMHLTAWREGETSFFPTQGTRAPDGCAFRSGLCGNYHNATADKNDRVNTLHIHNNSISNFNVFELDILSYYLKSTASAVRCVREGSVGQ